MALNGIDPAARTPARTRRNWGRTTKGAMTSTLATAQPVIVNGSGNLTLNIAAAGGIDPAVGALKLKLNVAGALSVGASGLAVAVDGTTIEIGSNALRIKDAGVSLAKLGVLTTKGDILGFSTVHARLPVGVDGQVLTADAASTVGFKWAPGSSVAGSDTYVQFNDSGAFGGDSKLTFNKTTGDLSASGAFDSAAPLTTVNGTTSGDMKCAQPFQGASYKKVIIYCTSLNSTSITYTFPTAFTQVPAAVFNNVVGATLIIGTTTVQVAGPGNTGWIVLEGY